MTRYLFLCLSLLAINVSFAQQGNGYVVLESGDTLKGYVKLVTGYRSAPQVIGLGATESSVNKNFSVDDCIGFGIGSDDYVRATVTMDMSLFANIDLRILNEDSTLTTTIFIKRIYKGQNLNLLKYHNGEETGFFRTADVKTHFFVQDSEKIQELIMTYTNSPTKSVLYSFDLERNSRSLRQLRPVYRDQLRMYFDWLKENRLRKKIDASEYREDHLLKIIAQIDAKFQAPAN